MLQNIATNPLMSHDYFNDVFINFLDKDSIPYTHFQWRDRKLSGGRVINDIIFIFGWTTLLRRRSLFTVLLQGIFSSIENGIISWFQAVFCSYQTSDYKMVLVERKNIMSWMSKKWY